MSAPSLSIVMPVYEEPEWPRRTVADAVEAIRRSPFADVEIVVVDDGSGPRTRAALDALEAPVPLRVLRHEANRGRFEARRTGLEAARGDYALLLDSRVSLEPDALAWVAAQLGPGRRVWNGHCEIDPGGGIYARFWQTLTTAVFREYFMNPRTTSFGLEEYDRFPKGTGHFLAPRAWLLDAIEAFQPRSGHMHLISDDTALIRHLAGRERINISPAFGSLYRARTSLKPFLAQALYRGSTLVDGFGRPGDRFFPAIATTPGLALGGLWLVLRRPRAAAALAAAAPAAFTGAAMALRRPPVEAAAFGLLAPLFSLFYAAGILRGLAIRR